MEPATGMMVTPNVRLVRPLAQGSMGSVWLGEHTTLETEVAVKFIASDTPQTERELLRRFEREAKAAAQIKSHHVVRTLDYGVMSGDVPYIVLELLEGESLQSRIDDYGTLTLEETKTVVTHVARALAGAHALGIVHRDIKPANIFATNSEVGAFYKVLDFGVAKQTQVQIVAPDTIEHADGGDVHDRSSVTRTGLLVGTPKYMSPEQIGGEETVSSDADLWALAVVAYECLTGQLPFAGDDITAVSLAILLTTYELPSTVNGNLPPSIDAWFERAFSQEPDDRFADAGQLAATFAAITDGEEDTANTAPRSSQRAARAAQQTKQPPVTDRLSSIPDLPLTRSALSWLAVGAAGAAVAIGGLGAYLALQADSEAAPPKPPAASVVATATPAPTNQPGPTAEAASDASPSAPPPLDPSPPQVKPMTPSVKPQPPRPRAKPPPPTPSKQLPERNLGF